MYIIFNIIKVKQEYLEQFLTGVHEHARQSSAEPGCVRYDVMQDVTDRQIICLYEVFRDEQAFHQHRTYAHYQHWMQSSKEWRQSENRVRHVLDYVYRTEDGQVAA